MRLNKKAVAAAVVATLGVSAAAMNTASAAIADGYYKMVILPTPVVTNVVPSTTTAPSFTVSSYNVGTNGNWNSSFTFGGTPGGTSNGMIDTGMKVTGSDGFQRGSGIGGDGYSGVIGIHIVGGVVTVGGTSFTGSTDASNNMTLTPTGRLGAIDAPNVFFNKPWNINDCGTTAGVCSPTNGNTAWSSFTTGAASAATGNGPINGKAFVTTTDQNADGLTDYLGVLVSGSLVGSQWAAFGGAVYYETWRVRLLSSASATSGFSVDTIPGTAGGNFAQYVGVQNPAVPVPAAVWLFGSGLLGLVGIARRKKSA